MEYYSRTKTHFSRSHKFQKELQKRRPLTNKRNRHQINGFEQTTQYALQKLITNQMIVAVELSSSNYFDRYKKKEENYSVLMKNNYESFTFNSNEDISKSMPIIFEADNCTNFAFDANKISSPFPTSKPKSEASNTLIPRKIQPINFNKTA